MHVLMTVDGSGDVVAYAANLISALSREGVSVAVAAHGPGLGGDQRDRLSRAGAAAVHETGLRLEWVPDLGDELERARAALGEIEQAERPDVVHANSFVCGSIEWNTPVVVAAHGCMLSRWRAVHGAPAPIAWRPYAELVASAIATADAVIAPTRAMRSALIAEYGGVARRVRVIHTGSPLPDAPESSREPLALAVGGMSDPAKNLATLAAAAAKMRHAVLVAGKTDPKPAAADDADPVRTPQLLGALTPDDLARVRSRAAVLVAPARYEPFGLSILEAARAGCALVLGDIASLRELWDGAAVFVPPGDADRLARTLDLVLEKAGLAMSLGLRAQRHAQRYPATAMAAAYARTYLSLRPGVHRVVA